MSNCLSLHKRLFAGSLICIFYLLGCFNLSAEPKAKPKAEKDSIAYHGSYIGVNLLSAMKAAYSDSWSIDAQYDINLYNKYIPCLEFGYSRAMLNNAAGTVFSSRGFYGKIGVNLPIAYYGRNAENMFFAGIRYGFSAFDYRLRNVAFSEGYWNDAYTSHYIGESTLAHWGEIVGGLRIQLWEDISVGWTVRIQKLFGAKEASHSNPPYVHGFGTNTGDTNAGFDIYLYYRFPW